MNKYKTRIKKTNYLIINHIFLKINCTTLKVIDRYILEHFSPDTNPCFTMKQNMFWSKQNLINMSREIKQKLARRHLRWRGDRPPELLGHNWIILPINLADDKQARDGIAPPAAPYIYLIIRCIYGTQASIRYMLKFLFKKKIEAH